MRAFPIISFVESSPFSPLLFCAAASASSSSENKTSLILATPRKNLSLPKSVHHLYCSSRSNFELGGDGNDVGDFSSLDEKEEEEEESVSETGDGVYIEIEKLGHNTRRIRSRISIDAPLDTIWNILTDYERLADFIPGLALSQLLQKTNNYARLFQVIISPSNSSVLRSFLLR